MNLKKKYSLVGKLSDIQNILIDIKQYGKIHPLITSVTKYGGESKGYQKFNITERPYRFIPLNIHYSVIVKSFGNSVNYKLIGIPFTKATIEYYLTEIGMNKTDVEFSLTLKSPIGYMLSNKMMDAQNKLMVAIEDELINPKA